MYLELSICGDINDCRLFNLDELMCVQVIPQYADKEIVGHEVQLITKSGGGLMPFKSKDYEQAVGYYRELVTCIATGEPFFNSLYGKIFPLIPFHKLEPSHAEPEPQVNKPRTLSD